jgi:hypothetical protein
MNILREESMTAIHRREMLGIMLVGAAVATGGLVMMSVPAESAPLTMSKSLSATTDNHVEDAVVVVRRHRRRVCWWRRGRRICRWR